MKSITVVTELDAPADVIWATVQRPEAFVHVAGAMLRYPAAERHAGPWRVDDETEGWAFLLRLIPFSRHTIRVVHIDHDAMTFLTEEGGGLVRMWKHHIAVETLPDGRSRYADRIDIDAGILTPAVAAFARLFYRYRQRRWRALAPLLRASGSRASDDEQRPG